MFFNNFYFILLLFGVSSCVVYPNMETIHIISNKKETVVSLGTSISPISINSTVTYGLTNHIAGKSYVILTLENGYYGQQSFGFYKQFQNCWNFSNFYGFGYGNGYTFFNTDGTWMDGNYKKYFTQCNLGKKGKEHSLEYGIGIQTGILQSNFSEAVFKNQTYEYVAYNKNSFVFEPQIFIRTGKGNFQYNVQVSSLWLFEFTKTTRDIPYSPLNL